MGRHFQHTDQDNEDLWATAEFAANDLQVVQNTWAKVVRDIQRESLAYSVDTITTVLNIGYTPSIPKLTALLDKIDNTRKAAGQSRIKNRSQRAREDLYNDWVTNFRRNAYSQTREGWKPPPRSAIDPATGRWTSNLTRVFEFVKQSWVNIFNNGIFPSWARFANVYSADIPFPVCLKLF